MEFSGEDDQVNSAGAYSSVAIFNNNKSGGIKRPCLMIRCKSQIGGIQHTCQVFTLDQADATSEMAIELPPEEQVRDQDFVGELLKSLYGARKAAINLEKTWQGEENGRVCSSKWTSRLVHGRQQSFVVVNATCVDSFME